MAEHAPKPHANHSPSTQSIQVGVVEWFPFEAYVGVEDSIERLERLGVSQLRTGVSWADWNRPGGPAWLEWLLPRLTERFDLLPCFHYVPPSLGEVPSTSAPPINLDLFAHFVGHVIEQYGESFEYVELWNEPNNRVEWDYTRDPGWIKFSAMVGAAASWSRELGKRVVLGGLSPIDPNVLEILFERGLMRFIDVVGVHGFPGTWDARWSGWPAEIQRIQAVLDRHGSDAPVWITEAGYSTARHDEPAQVLAFVDATEAPGVERLYWYGLRDLEPERSAQTGFHLDEHDYHCGLVRNDGTPKLLYRAWERGGFDAVRELAGWQRERVSVEDGQPLVIVTGGAGFIGTNLVDRLLTDGRAVVIVDNLARSGAETNLRWLRQRHGGRAQFEAVDLRDPFALRRALEHEIDAVYHLAGQVAVTTSLVDPISDFEINARGTLNLLELLRARPTPPPLIFTSTNKVYGALEDLKFVARGPRYEPADTRLREHGIDERRPLDLHSPYGCSKGAADQYILDYARSYGLPTVVFRMSCIYGPRQLGTEDQGWVAHFMLSAIDRRPITIYGDGRQVRDVLAVGDLVDALVLAREQVESLRGEAFNIGGGPSRTLSLLQLCRRIERLHGAAPKLSFEDWRVGDQRYYVSDTRRFAARTGWRPRHSLDAGLEQLYAWLCQLRGVNAKRPRAAAFAAQEEAVR
ncbi:NAD-dependent epimerase/dehydratase family protein [Enhygromyxa salina]|uniref:CDP-paratose 2-epimerase n=1 Tax=Enhygromyxa salina TaxID=215803 RepID=A0A2S9XTQ5_9BACT|nr:NAD-dependent epimerase/dehydratase family protein [Enhygromyxa salina]PRP96258.1 CDP-paratose 2-epimerase [Enhygromyxa salina]